MAPRPIEMRLRAVITRKTGAVEDRGTVAYFHRSPARQFLWRLGRWLRSIR